MYILISKKTQCAYDILLSTTICIGENELEFPDFLGQKNIFTFQDCRIHEFRLYIENVLYRQILFLYFYAIFIKFILYVYFIVHIVTVLFCMQINK